MKRRCTLEEIHAEMQRRIKESFWADGFCRDCTAPEPYRISPDGISNWAAAAASKTGCESFLFDIIAALREECELKPETLSEAVERLLVWGGWSNWNSGGTKTDHSH